MVTVYKPYSHVVAGTRTNLTYGPTCTVGKFDSLPGHDETSQKRFEDLIKRGCHRFLTSHFLDKAHLLCRQVQPDQTHGFFF